jgi:hypothetical protein
MSDEKENKVIILKTLVGSRAHGLENPESDYDYRGIFVVPTSELLKVNPHYKTTSWIEGKVDDTGHEIKDFLNYATRSNPSILETLVSPIQEVDKWGLELRDLFPYIWNSAYVYASFSGYSHNQRKKFLEDKDARPWKYATAYLCVLMLGIELLEHETMTVNIKEQEKVIGKVNPGMFNEYLLRTVKNAGPSMPKGDIINIAEKLQARFTKAFDNNHDHKTDMDRVNDFLLRVRQEHWNG